jgi:hypothetical protein
VTAPPAWVTIQSGSHRSGDAGSLRANDGSFLEVNADRRSGRSSWYGKFTLVPNALASLFVSYRGSNSAACSQTVSLWNWATGVWVTLDSRTVSATETAVNKSPTSAPGSFVSGSSGAGTVAVRVRCTRTAGASFFARGDVLTISYEKP